jgi:hypothetical protein
MKPNIVIIGYGRWAQKIEPALQKQFNIVGKADSKSSIHDFTSDYFAGHRNDWVYIASPISTHADLVRRCLSRGKNVICEKPLSLEATEVEILYSLAEDRQLILVENYHYAMHSGLRELVDCPEKVELVWKKFGTFDEGILENLFVHVLAILRQIGVQCSSWRLKTFTENEFHAFGSDNSIEVSVEINRKCLLKEFTLKQQWCGEAKQVNFLDDEDTVAKFFQRCVSSKDVSGKCELTQWSKEISAGTARIIKGLR